MDGKAIISTGEPNEFDDKRKYYEALERDTSIMERLAIEENYSIENLHPGEIMDYFENPFIEDLLFYYFGHSKNGVFEGEEIKPFLRKLDNVKGDKVIVFDSCMGMRNIKGIYLPKNTKLISANEIPLNKSLAKILWDWESFRGNNLRNLNKRSFNLMKHNWVYFRERGSI
jgi:hypothetical protein